MKDQTMTQAVREDDGRMIDYLEDLLTRQIAKLKQYDIDGAMRLAEESETISQEVTRSTVLQRPDFENQSHRIQGLYRELCLQIASQRQEVSDKLEQIRTGMRTLGAYAGK